MKALRNTLVTKNIACENALCTKMAFVPTQCAGDILLVDAFHNTHDDRRLAHRRVAAHHHTEGAVGRTAKFD